MKKTAGLLLVFLGAVLIFWSLFFQLGKMPFRIWDETRLITSAYEMTQNHKYLTPTIENEPDMWNTKPPLMIWAEALCIKIFGFHEWSVRLPAAMCGMFTILLLVLLIKKVIPNDMVWLTAIIVLCTSTGFIGYHTARGGDYDAMLTLFITAYLFSFFLYTESNGSAGNKYLLLFFAFLTLACLTKGIAGLLVAPALFVYVIFRRRLGSTLGNYRTYLGIIAFLFFVLGYYLLREHYNPGYLKAVADNELGARFSAPIQGAQETTWYTYIDLIRFEQFSVWMWALPVSLILILFLERGQVFRLAVFSWLCTVIFISVISASGTKYTWYDMPAFPLLAVIVSIVIFQLSEIAGRLFSIKKQLAAGILILIFSIQPLWQCYNYIRWQGDDLLKDNFYATSYYFKQALMGKKDVRGYRYISCCYNIQWRLYVKMLDSRGVNIKDGYPDSGLLKPGDKIIMNQPEVIADIDKKYNYSVIEDFYGVKNCQIISAK